jgi:hypothetical protein
LFLLQLSACSGGTSNTGTTHPGKVTATAASQLQTTFDPCTLFSKDEASLPLEDLKDLLNSNFYVQPFLPYGVIQVDMFFLERERYSHEYKSWPGPKS